MTYPLKVREEAARRLNEFDGVTIWNAGNVANAAYGRFTCNLLMERELKQSLADYVDEMALVHGRRRLHEAAVFIRAHTPDPHAEAVAETTKALWSAHKSAWPDILNKLVERVCNV